jgi:hypothetical protein
MGVRVEASEKAKGTSEGFTVNQSIIDRRSETEIETQTETEDMMRWDDGRAWVSERRIEWESDHGQNKMEDGGPWYVDERGK